MEDFRSIGQRVSNWGRWGDDDERGTLNLITADHIVAAARLVRTGQTFSLGIPFGPGGPQDGRVRENPVRFMKETGNGPSRNPGAFRYADDYVFMALQAATQWDALAHVHYDGQMYNGFPASGITVQGTDRCSIENLLPGVVGRGVLVDMARWADVDWLPLGTPITPADLDAAIAAQDVALGEGDILLVRTGWRRKFVVEGDRVAFKAGEPGLTIACAEWLHERGVAAVGCDNFGVEVLPGEYTDEYMPFHMVAIRDMGMPLAEILDLEDLSADCAADRRFDFFFAGSPLAFPGGVGSPVNPLALK